MGSSQSAQTGACAPGGDLLRLAMANLRDQGVTGGGACGCGAGCPGPCAAGGGFFGGAADAEAAKGLREYESSLSAKAKEATIRRLARAMKHAGVAVDPDGDLDEIVRQLIAQLPDPRKGRTFKTDAESQAQVCRKVAEAMNNEWSPGATKPGEMFIDTSLSPAEVCRRVGEVAHSFAAGVNTEFLAVTASVRNALRAVEVLDQIMAEVFGKIKGKVDKTGDAKLAREVDPLADLYDRAQVERRKQETLLKNILHIELPPAQKALELAMRDESEQSALIKRLGLRPGTSEFADSLAMAVSGLGTAASVAAKVHKALKLAGVSVREYLASPTYADLQRTLDARVEAGQVSPEDFARFIEAVDTLRRNFNDRAEPRFHEALEGLGKEGGRRGARGGADDDEYRTPVAKRVERAELDKKLIVADFVGRLTRGFDEMLAAVKALAPELGKKIPITDKTDVLRDALVKTDALREMRERRIEQALVGVHADAASRERKGRFLSALRLVASACDSLLSLEMYRAAGPLISRLRAAVDAVVKTVDNYSDVLVRRQLGGAGEGDSKHGGADDDLLPELNRGALSLNEAVSEFTYFYYVAKVRANLEQSSRELEAFGEGYVETLGDAVAARLWNLRQARRAISERIAARPGPLGPAGGAADKRFAGAKKWVDQEFDVKEKFYKTLQAVDLYMKAFTVGITKDPDAVRDIKKMLDGTSVIARWFSEATGDSIWRAFDQMRGTDFAGAIAEAPAAATLRNPVDGHYYAKVSGYLTGAGGLAPPPSFGVPQVGVDAGAADDDAHPDRAARAKKDVVAALDHFQALKNLVNAFARIGDRFGGREIQLQIFQSPTQIFKGLMDYLKQSALSINAGTEAAAPVVIPTAFALAGGVQPPAVANGVDLYQVHFGAVQAAHQGNYGAEDRYFVLIVKAMAAKILTTLGVFDMFERSSPVYDLTPTRMIVGGAGGGDAGEPEVLPGAAELYFRLPRLVEFYRQLLYWDGSGADVLRVAMLPELEGVFSGLIRLVFLKVTTPGDYSDSEGREVIREVNRVYAHFREKAGEKAVSAAVSALVVEINQRFGLVKQDDIKKYLGLVRRADRAGDLSQVNDTSYAILPGEDEVEVERRAPSDRYVIPGAPPPPAAGLPREFAGRELLDDDIAAPASRRMLLREFRARLEREFEAVPRAEFGATSYAPLIAQASVEIQRARTDDARVAAALKLIQSTTLVGLDASKAFMFHETVVVGLNVIGGIYSLVSRFEALVDLLNPALLENAVMDACHAAAAAGAPAPGFDRAALLGAGFLGLQPAAAAAQGRYLLAGTAGAGVNAALSLGRRGGVPNNVDANAVYTFGSNVMADLAANAGNRLPDPPSTYADAGRLGALPPNQQNTVRALRLFARLATDYPLMMRDLLENLFDLSSLGTGLVEVRFPQAAAAPLAVGFSKLRGLAESLLSEVKYYLDLFRPSIPKETVARFEAIGNAGSVFWLEEKLVDTFFRGQSDDAKDQRATLDGISRRAAAAFTALTRDTQVVCGANLTRAVLVGPFANAIIPPTDVLRLTQFETYGRTLSSMVFYDGAADDSGLSAGNLVVPANNDSYSLGNLIHQARPAPGAADFAPAIRRSQDLYQSGHMTANRSLLMAFNQLLAQYLAAFTDPGNSKIYLPLINAFANGVASRAVSTPNGNSYPDLSSVAFGNRGDPKPGAVVLQSLAYLLQRLVKDINPTNSISDHLLTTMVDVPLYVKERYRAGLPGFMRLFELLNQKCDFLRQVIQKTGINCARPEQRASVGAGAAGTQVRSAGADRAGGGAPGFLDHALDALQPLDEPAAAGAAAAAGLGQTDADMKARLSELIDSISNHVYSLSSCAIDTLKELSDNPVYFQTQEGSIETYKLRNNGKLPLMPLSLSLTVLSDLTPAAGAPGVYDDARLFPRASLGETPFKIQYGMRGILVRGGPVSYETMPGVRAALDSYNALSAKREQLEGDHFLSFAKNVVLALRYFAEARNYKSALSTSTNVASLPSLVGGANAIVRFDPVTNTGNSAYAVNAADQDVASVAESADQDETLGKIAAVVGGRGARAGTTSRKMERILNIIDMNIIPLNVHALMRGIPLANLYNYEVAFEQMVAAIYGESASKYMGGAGTITDATTTRTRQMFLRLLVDPFLDLDATSPQQGQKLYGSDVMDLGSAGFVHRIFRGDNDLGLGRPKFLSDQLFNKALFGSTYQSDRDFDEAGPGVGAGVSRGRENVRARIAMAARNISDGVAGIVSLRMQLLATAQAAAAAAGGGAALDDGAAGDAAANAALDAAAVLASIDSVVRSTLTLFGAASEVYGRAYTWPGAAVPAGLAPFNAELTLQLNPAAAAGVAAAGSNLQDILAALSAGAPARGRVALDILRGRTAAGAVATAANSLRLQALLGGVGGNAGASAGALRDAILASPESRGSPQEEKWYPRQGESAAKLTYLGRAPGAGPSPEAEVVSVPVGSSANKARLECIGRMRFDTRYVRVLFFIVNVLRLVRLKFNRELTQSRNVLVSSHSAVAPGVTEYGADPFGPNEDYASTLPNLMPRYNDRDTVRY